jgi:hypothetical protein
VPELPDPWANTPRLLQELCEGHGQYVLEAYRLDYASGSHSWLCKSCWVTYWHAAGKPPQGPAEVASA